MNQCVLDELEVETQHFSRLISDARRKFKDFLIAVDKISPFFIEMYVRNSIKPNHRRKDTLSSSTPYRKLRQDYSSSEENIPQRLRHKGFYRCSVFASEQDFKNNNISNDYENCRKGKLQQNGKTDNVSYPVVLDCKVTRQRQYDDKRMRNSTSGSSKIVIIGSQRDSESEPVRAYRISTEGTKSLQIPRYLDNCDNNVNVGEVTNSIVTDFKGVPRRTGSKARIPSYVENHYHNTSVDIEEAELSPAMGERGPVLFEILNSEELQHSDNRRSVASYHQDVSRENKSGRFILDCSLSEDSRHERDAPMIPIKDESPWRLKCDENHGIIKEKGNCSSKEGANTWKRVEDKLNNCVSNVDQRKARNRSSVHLSDTSNLSYSKDQRKKLKKKMKNALKKPENCCFMGQV